MSDLSQTPAWFRYPQYPWKKKHAIVIGAGIAGCQMAWHLSQKNWQVTLIERHGKIATEASGNPAGIISPKMTAERSPGEDFYVECFQYTLKILETLQQQGQQLDWHACGLLQLAHNLGEEKRWQSLKQRNFSKDFLQLLDQQDTSQCAGIPINYQASFFPQAGWINPASFCAALSNTTNCTKLLETAVISLKKAQHNWHVLDHQNQSIAAAEIVIISNGKDLNHFSQSKNLPSMPVAGQTTVAQASAVSSQLKRAIGHQGYLTPATNNTTQLTFGASFERNITEVLLTSEANKTNLAQLQKYLPQLADSLKNTTNGHAAIRITTPDRFPYVGGLPDTDFYTQYYHDLHHGKKWKKYPDAQYQKGLFVLGGLGSRGLTTSGLCAKTLTDILQNNSQTSNNHLIKHYCHPARFLIKNLSRTPAKQHLSRKGDSKGKSAVV